MRAFGNPRLVTALAMSVLAFLYAPILVMMFFSFNDSQYTGPAVQWIHAPLVWRTLPRRANADVHLEQHLCRPRRCCFISALFGLPAAIALDRFEFPGKGAFRRIVMLPIVFPGIITGIALLGFYLTIHLRLSLHTIMLGQGTALMCVTITEVFARLQQLGKSQAEAAVKFGSQ